MNNREFDKKAINAGEKISQNLGADAVGKIMADGDKLQNILSKITPADMDKITDLLNHPDKLDSALSSQKARENLKKYFG